MSTGRNQLDGPPAAAPRSRRRGPQAGRIGVGLLTILLLLFAAVAGGVLLLLMVGNPAGRTGAVASATPTATPQASTSSGDGAATATSGPSSRPTDSAAPAAALEATIALLFPASGTACGDSTGNYTSCPVSSRMEQRLTALQAMAGIPYRPMCRCSRDWVSVAITAAATADTVDVTFKFSGGQVTMVVSMVPGVGSSGWVADDTTCNGGDLYSQTEPPPCWAPG